MSAYTKVTISLPQELYRAAERERKLRKQSRSQFFRSALAAALLEQQRERQASERYVAAYLAVPEKEPEVSTVHELSRAVLAAEPWE